MRGRVPLDTSCSAHDGRILILGAGPTGLGAARQLERNHHRPWRLLEACGNAGGLSASFVDGAGFTWDVGGHVQFSHYAYFDAAMEEFLGVDGWLHHRREAWIWMRERFIPYPLQKNIHHLDMADQQRCLQGLLDVTDTTRAKATNFGQWIDANFGTGIADIFMRPYNAKVWAYAPELLSDTWVGERVAPIELRLLQQALASKEDDRAWGPNHHFQFPKRGGTGAIWNACAKQLPAEKLHFNTRVMRVDLGRHEVVTEDGRTFHYETLISTLPLRELIRLSGQVQLQPAAERGLMFSSSNIVGLGLKGQAGAGLADKCWLYFPETNCPFYRATVFSNYSPSHVPDPRRYWSLMLEVSESAHKPVDAARLLETVIQGALDTRLIKRREDLVSTWSYRAAYGYPTPGLHRDEALDEIIPFFERHGVYSRGRFGLWKYEVSNQDHSFMQGVELVERLLNGRLELTACEPDFVNVKKHPWPFERWIDAAISG